MEEFFIKIIMPETEIRVKLSGAKLVVKRVQILPDVQYYCVHKTLVGVSAWFDADEIEEVENEDGS